MAGRRGQHGPGTWVQRVLCRIERSHTDNSCRRKGGGACANFTSRGYTIGMFACIEGMFELGCMTFDKGDGSLERSVQMQRLGLLVSHSAGQRIYAATAHTARGTLGRLGHTTLALSLG